MSKLIQTLTQLTSGSKQNHHEPPTHHETILTHPKFVIHTYFYLQKMKFLVELSNE